MTNLTPRERDVAALLVEGLSNKLIAARLDISEHTAHFHVGNAVRKLGAENRTHAAVLFDRQQRDRRRLTSVA